MKTAIRKAGGRWLITHHRLAVLFAVEHTHRIEVAA